jgi:hypothetical protein
MKTPEELAKEYASRYHNELSRLLAATSFLAGHQAAAPQWISVKDRLPEEDEVVLVHAQCHSAIMPKIIELGHWDTLVRRNGIKFITHWMPLPPPPKEDK